MKNLLIITTFFLSQNLYAGSMKELLITFEDSVYIYLYQQNIKFKSIQFYDYQLKSSSEIDFYLKTTVKIENPEDQLTSVLSCEGQIRKTTGSFESTFTKCFFK